MGTHSPEALEKTVRASTDAKKPAAPPEAQSSLQEGDVVDGRFRVVELLGAGAQGEVWRAEDLEISGHTVALKLLGDRTRSEAERDAALRELRMLAAVSHPSVVQFKGHGWFAGRLWFVMPYYKGTDLENAMPISRVEARRIFETLAGGLAAVHAKGLRHQDIKPSNIFLAQIEGLEERLPVLIDFGVAAEVGEHFVAGSPNYFPPELADGWPTPAPTGAEADVFSLMLSLRNALEPQTAPPDVHIYEAPSVAVRAKQLIKPPQSKDLAYLAPHFARWLALDPLARPTAAELITELHVLTAPEEAQRERALIMRRVLPWAIALSVLIAIGSYVGWSAILEARKAAATEAYERELADREAQTASQRAAALGEELDDALGRAESSSHQTQDALARLSDAEEAIGRAEGDVASMRSARDRLRAALADARRSLTEQASALADTEASLRQVQSDIETARRELAAARAELGTTRAERDSLRAERDTARQERDALRAERDALRESETTLRARVSAVEAEAASAARAAEGDREARVTLEERARTLESRIATLESELAAARAALAAERARPSAPAPSGGGDSPTVVTPRPRPGTEAPATPAPAGVGEDGPALVLPRSRGRRDDPEPPP